MIALHTCAWCGQTLGESEIDVPPGHDTCAVTHGICDDCLERLMAEATRVHEEKTQVPA